MPESFSIAEVLVAAVVGIVMGVCVIALYGLRVWLPQKLQYLRAQVKSKDEQLAARDEVIDARDEQLKAKDSDIQARSEQVRAKDDQLRAKEEQLKLAKHQLASLTDQLSPVLAEHQQHTRKLLEEDLAGHEHLYEVVRDRYMEYEEFINNLVETRDRVLPDAEELSAEEADFFRYIDELIDEKENLGNRLEDFRQAINQLRDERIYASITPDTIANAHGNTSKTLHIVGTLANMEAISKRISARMPQSVKEELDERSVTVTLSSPGMRSLLGGLNGGAFAGAASSDFSSALSHLESSSINRLMHKVEHHDGGGILPTQNDLRAYQPVGEPKAVLEEALDEPIELEPETEEAFSSADEDDIAQSA